MDFLREINSKVLLEFGEQMNIQNLGTDGDRLFPNIKTQYFEAEYMRLAKSPSLPRAAKVHGFDSEAAIGKRPTADIVRIEQFLIKEKLSVTETIIQLTKRGVVNGNQILQYIFDDIGNLAMAVRTRAEVAKFEAFCTGKMHIHENNVSLEVDYDVPDENRYNLNWANADADILGDIRRIVYDGRKKGYRYNRAVCSQKIMDMLIQNTAIQKAVNGNNMLGVMITEEGINQLFNKLFGFTISTNDDYYEYDNGTPDGATARLFDENKFILYVGGNNGSCGVGLWGTTTEEEVAGGFEGKQSYDGLVYITQWSEQDPPIQWTKASGVFVPVLPSPKSHVIITVADGSKTLKSLDINTEPSETTTNGSKVDIYPSVPASGNSYVYTAAATYQNPEVGTVLSNWTTITDGAEIVVATKTYDKITVAEIDSNKKVVGLGHAVIYKKA